MARTTSSLRPGGNVSDSIFGHKAFLVLALYQRVQFISGFRHLDTSLRVIARSVMNNSDIGEPPNLLVISHPADVGPFGDFSKLDAVQKFIQLVAQVDP